VLLLGTELDELLTDYDACSPAPDARRRTILVLVDSQIVAARELSSGKLNRFNFRI